MTVVTITATVAIPRVPNFLVTTGGMVLPLSAFDDDALREIAAQWTSNLLERAAEQRKDGTK